MKKRKLFSVLTAAIACLICAFSVKGAVASAQDSSALKIDFSDSSAYVSTGTLVTREDGASFGGGTKVETKETFTSFLLYVDVKSVAGESLTVSFGENSLRIYADGVVYSQMQQTAAGRAFSFAEIANGGVIMVEYIGGRVSVGMAGANQPNSLLETPIASYFVEAKAPCSVVVATDENTALNISSLRVYTLAPSIEILPDDWEESDTDRPDKNAPVGAGKEGCGSVVSLSSATLCAVTFAGAALIFRKKER
ncbi:MAG: hypothetical protein IJB97_07145 [Clostridia bacterium]|nr:hypothetical protein [Clostridia bacterium]